MNIFFFSHSENARIFCKILQLMEKYNDISINKYYFLVESQTFEKYIKKNTPQDKTEIIYVYGNFNINKLDHIDLEKLKMYEQKYGIPNLWLYVTADRYYREFEEEKILKALNWHIEFCENLFNNCKNDIFISTDVSGIYGGLMEKIAKERGIISLKIVNSSLPKPTRLYVSDSMYFIPNGMEEKYNELLNKDLTDEELQIAKEIVDFYRNKYSVPASMATFKSKRINYLRATKNIFRKGFNFFFRGVSNLYTISDVIKYSVFFIKFRKFIIETFYKRLFKEPDFKEKYFYFPLHEQPELSIDLNAPFYMDQIYLIENIAKCMPIGYKLYVKEHPATIGMRPVKYYKRFQKIPRIKLIKTEFNHNTLIKNSAGITTITGTAGWEGLILGKPVMSFGYTFYNIMKGSVFFVKDFFNLPYLFQEIVSSFKPNEENILKICYAKYISTYPGSIAPPSFDNTVVSDENIQNLYKVIINEIQTRINKNN